MTAGLYFANKLLAGLSRVHLKQNMHEHALCYAQKAIELAIVSGNERAVALAQRNLNTVMTNYLGMPISAAGPVGPGLPPGGSMLTPKRT